MISYDSRTRIDSIPRLSAFHPDADGGAAADTSESQSDYAAAFNPATNRCETPETDPPEAGLRYDLVAGIDRDAARSNTGSGWAPVPDSYASLNLNDYGHTIAGLFIDINAGPGGGPVCGGGTPHR